MNSVFHTRPKKIVFSPDFMAIFGMAIGRLVGAIREILIVALFGASYFADISVLLWTVPELLVFFCTANGINSALSRRFVGATDADMKRLVVNATLLCSVLVLSFAVIASFDLILFISLVAPGVVFSIQDQNFSFWLTLVLFSAPLVVVASVITAALNANKKYIHQGLGTAIANIGFLIGILLGWLTGYILEFVALGTIVGLLLRVCWLSFYAPVNRIDIRFWSCFVSSTYSLLPSIIIASLSFLVFIMAPVVLRALSSTLGEGYLVVVALGIKLIQLPLMVVLNSLAIVSLQKMSVAQHTHPLKVPEILKQRVLVTLGFSSILAIVVYAIVYLVGAYIPLYSNLSANHASFLVSFLLNATAGLPLMGLGYLLNSDFHARGEAKLLPVASGIAFVIVLWGLDSGLYGVLTASTLYHIWISFIGVNTFFVLVLRVYQLGFHSNLLLLAGSGYASLVGFIWSL